VTEGAKESDYKEMEWLYSCRSRAAATAQLFHNGWGNRSITGTALHNGPANVFNFRTISIRNARPAAVGLFNLLNCLAKGSMKSKKLKPAILGIKFALCQKAVLGNCMQYRAPPGVI
jgi:hypothetical protein